MTTNNTNIVTATVESIERESVMKRANRVSIQTTESGVGYRADFYRTHKKVDSIASTETGWVANPEANKSQNREDFRRFITAHAADIGIDWDPEDRRDITNKRLAKYEDEQLLKEDTIRMIEGDISRYISKMPNADKISGNRLEVTDVTPMDTTASGKLLITMGITNGRYNSTGNWAWANIEVTVIMTVGDQEIYQIVPMQLVSGQLKKMSITQTEWNAQVTKSLIEIGAVQPEPPKEEKAKKSKKAEAESTEDTGTSTKSTGKKSTKSKAARGAAKGEQTVAQTIAKIEAQSETVGDL